MPTQLLGFSIIIDQSWVFFIGFDQLSVLFNYIDEPSIILRNIGFGTIGIDHYIVQPSIMIGVKWYWLVLIGIDIDGY